MVGLSHGARLFATTAVTLVAFTGCDASAKQSSAAYETTARFPHDSAAYTQGLLRADGVLFESTGQYGHSDIRRVDMTTGRVLASRSIAANRFGEGLTLYHNRLYQLTWKAGVAYTYDPATLTPRDSLSYPG
ncbi:MAG: glutaminyl-peptide cyclotransferase, partial [Gemmatimonadota bacterium]|nr:glutaminyl-peptide cyclotransferase [Gemmatimonadota bacterium]